MTRFSSLLLIVLLTSSPAAVLLCGRACEAQPAYAAVAHCKLHTSDVGSTLTAGVADCRALHDAVPATAVRDTGVGAPPACRTIVSAISVTTYGRAALRSAPSPHFHSPPLQLRI